jgi:cobalamin biosynthesis protein CobW
MKVPATVITGFLGSGKTTLIRHLLQNANGRRFALIVNEFGDVGVDADLLSDCGEVACKPGDIVELANGCICCTVADDFLPTMTALLDRPDPPEHILIETSGLALPKPLIKAFTWPTVRSLASVDAVIALVDCAAVAEGRFAPDHDALEAQRADDENLDHETPLEELFEEQLGAADLIVLTKIDLVDAETLARVEAEVLKDARPQARIIRIANGQVDVAALLGIGAAAEDDLDSRHSHHDNGEDHDHDDFNSVVCVPPVAASMEEAAARVRDAVAVHDLLRVKGTVRIEGKPMRLVVQAAGPRLETYFDRPWTDGEQPSLVAIAESGKDWEAVHAALGPERAPASVSA